jgi:anthranilate 1,2-dioxygenase (deaminating, decarboxylating) small subunit
VTAVERSIEQFLYRKAELCDRREWDGYLALFDPACEYHVPQWLTDTEHAANPKSQMSYIYWKDRSGLEDRIFRLRTERAASYRPPVRTLHMVSNIRPVAVVNGDWAVKTNWCTHLYRQGKADMLFGWSDYLLSPGEADWTIRRKHAVILNDVINLALDFYHL